MTEVGDEPSNPRCKCISLAIGLHWFRQDSSLLNFWFSAVDTTGSNGNMYAKGWYFLPRTSASYPSQLPLPTQLPLIVTANAILSTRVNSYVPLWIPKSPIQACAYVNQLKLRHHILWHHIFDTIPLWRTFGSWNNQFIVAAPSVQRMALMTLDLWLDQMELRNIPCNLSSYTALFLRLDVWENNIDVTERKYSAKPHLSLSTNIGFISLKMKKKNYL